MMRRLCFTVLFLALTGSLLWAQAPDNHLIKARIRGLANKTAYLAHFYGPTQYIPRDTAQADAQGQLVFDGTKPLPGGLYMIVVDSKPVVDLVIGEPQFSIETDTADVVGTMQVTGSRENTIFYDYQKFMSKKYGELAALQKQPNSANLMATVRQEIETYRKDFMTKNAGTLTTKLFLAANEPEVPPAPKLANGRPDSAWVFNYYKNHYFDGFDFSDDRLLRTPFFQKKLERYLKELTVQTVDSLGYV